jgi:hypothetical protein
MEVRAMSVVGSEDEVKPIIAVMGAQEHFWNGVAFLFNLIAWLGFVVVVVSTCYASTLMLVEVFGEINWTSNDLWLYRWQTLIAGALAVLAAIITVRQMKTTDKLQEKRHQDLISLNLRSDRLRIQRAAMPYARMLRISIDICRKDFTDKESMAKPTLEFLNRVVFNLEELVKAISSEDFEKAIDLFEPDMNHNLKSLKRVTQRLADIQAKLTGALLVLNNKDDGKTQVLLEFAGDEVGKISYLGNKFIVSLEELSLYYDRFRLE